MPTGIYERTEKHKKKISKARKGWQFSKETRMKISQSLLGHIVSEETRKKISQSVSLSKGLSCGKGSPKYIWNSKGLLHRQRMEDMIGRKLAKKEIVHHFNGNGEDNREENLCLLRHVIAHNRLHSFVQRHNLDINLLKFSQNWLITH